MQPRNQLKTKQGTPEQQLLKVLDLMQGTTGLDQRTQSHN